MNRKSVYKMVFYHLLIGTAISFICLADDERVKLPVSLVEKLNINIISEIDNRSATLVDESEARIVRGYTGTAQTHDVEFTYEIFPELLVVRILPTGNNAMRKNWLYVAIGGISPNGVVRQTTEERSILDEAVGNKILACASGILYRDITALKIGCRPMENHILYTQKVKWSLGEIRSIRILLDKSYKLIAIDSSSGGLWKSLQMKDP